MNQVQRPSVCRLMIYCSTRNPKGDHVNTNKCKVTMISSKIALTPTLDLRERLRQICQAWQVSSMTINLMAKCLVCSRLSLTSPTLRLVMSIPERSRYYSKKPRKETKLAYPVVNLVGHGDPKLGVARLESSPDSQFSTKADGVYHNMVSRTRATIASWLISPLHSNSQEEESNLV